MSAGAGLPKGSVSGSWHAVVVMCSAQCLAELTHINFNNNTIASYFRFFSMCLFLLWFLPVVMVVKAANEASKIQVSKEPEPLQTGHLYQGTEMWQCLNSYFSFIRDVKAGEAMLDIKSGRWFCCFKSGLWSFVSLVIWFHKMEKCGAFSLCFILALVLLYCFFFLRRIYQTLSAHSLCVNKSANTTLSYRYLCPFLIVNM